MNSRYIQMILLLMMFSAAIFAENIYKSVDENGRVTYSSTPPEDSRAVIEIDIRPPPTPEQVEAAQLRHEQNLKAAELLDANRKSRNEMVEEKNRLKLEKQKQFEKKAQREESKDNRVYPYYYPYYRPRYPGIPPYIPPAMPGTRPPGMRPPDGHRPHVDRPINRQPSPLPAP